MRSRGLQTVALLAVAWVLLAPRRAVGRPVEPRRRCRAPLDPRNASDVFERYDGDPTDGARIVCSDGVVRTHRTPPGPRYKRAQLPRHPGSECAWVAMMRELFARHGVAGRKATLLIAHVARETTHGRNLWNSNFGNAKQFGRGAWHRLTDGEPYIAYATPDEGIRGLLGLMRSPRYARSWALLEAGDVGWYGQLGRDGWYEGDPVHGQRSYETNHLPAVERCGG